MSAPSFLPEMMRRPMPDRVKRVGWISLATGVLLLGAAYAIDPQRGAVDNVILFLFVVSVGVGALFLVALEHIAGAVWSVPIRRVVEFVAGLIPLLPLVALPLFFHMHDLFHWTHAEVVSADPILQGKSPYLNTPFFLARFVLVMLLWGLFFWLFTRNSLRQDTTREPSLTKRNARLAAAFLPVFAITITVTAIDWGMSLEPHWFSTIYGVYFFSGTVLAALSVTTILVVLLLEGGYLPALRGDHLYSLGALIFAFLNFWAYIAFSQFLLIWYANVPEETYWFINRWQHGWQWVSILLIVLQFGVPYFVLLPQEAKMDPRRLKRMAIWLLVAHLVDLYWLTMPTFSESATVGWQELSIPFIVAGLVIVVAGWKMGRHPIIPVGDPKLERGLEFRL